MRWGRISFGLCFALSLCFSASGKGLQKSGEFGAPRNGYFVLGFQFSVMFYDRNSSTRTRQSPKHELHWHDRVKPGESVIELDPALGAPLYLVFCLFIARMRPR